MITQSYRIESVKILTDKYNEIIDKAMFDMFQNGIRLGLFDSKSDIQTYVDLVNVFIDGIEVANIHRPEFNGQNAWRFIAATMLVDK